ncbi:MAG: hypothetical protein NC400_14815, partial [Clostridium sp.]|nr:hypothetical protein [Clostridium sp.]
MEKKMTLLNKDRPILQAVYDDELSAITKITEIFDLRYAPPAIVDYKKGTNRRLLNNWWRSRAIPASRQHLSKSFPYLDNTVSLLEKNMGLSLSDRYWMTSEPDKYKWSNVNFFDNPFSEDLGVITLGEKQQSYPSSEDMFSPNSTLNGDLQKKWTIQGGHRMLLKSGSGPYYQEPYNEVIASELFKRLLSENDFVTYTLQGRYCACPNMLEEDEELVPMWDILGSGKKLSSQNDFQFCVSLCRECGLSESEINRHFEKMFTCDFILANHDRHYRNFGLVRNVETLEYTRMAPIYDTGACLWSDKIALDKHADYEYTAKPFGANGMKPKEQLKLFHDFEWFDETKLEGFADKASEILSLNPLLPEKKKTAVLKGLCENIDYAVDYIRGISIKNEVYYDRSRKESRRNKIL